MTWLLFFTCLAGLAVAAGAATVSVSVTIQRNTYDPHAVPRADADDGEWINIAIVDASTIMPLAYAEAIRFLTDLDQDGAIETFLSPPPISSAELPGVDR